jgi:hypothetical protein
MFEEHITPMHVTDERKRCQVVASGFRDRRMSTSCRLRPRSAQPACRVLSAHNLVDAIIDLFYLINLSNKP